MRNRRWQLDIFRRLQGVMLGMELRRSDWQPTESLRIMQLLVGGGGTVKLSVTAKQRESERKDMLSHVKVGVT